METDPAKQLLAVANLLKLLPDAKSRCVATIAGVSKDSFIS